MKSLKAHQKQHPGSNAAPRSDVLISLGDVKRQAVQAAANRQAAQVVDARQAFGFMPMEMKGAAIRWRGF